MIICYINLDDAVSRREAIEANFATTHDSSLPWQLVRFPAISHQDDRVRTIAGFRTNREKACVLSHLSVLMQACKSETHTWIVEDDVLFSKKSFTAISSYLELYKNADWDIIFTGIDACSPAHMLELFSLRESIINDEIMVADLENFPFASANSYIINAKRKEKILDVLMMHDLTDCVWDLFLSQCVNQKKIKAFVTIPFVTELSEFSTNSQIQDNKVNSTDLFFYAFRKMMGFSSDIEQVKRLINMIDSDHFTDRSDCCGKIISGFISPKIIHK